MHLDDTFGRLMVATFIAIILCCALSAQHVALSLTDCTMVVAACWLTALCDIQRNGRKGARS